jgi:hypothetical protein
MSGHKKSFGMTVSRERERLKIGLCEMPKLIGVSPTYISRSVIATPNRKDVILRASVANRVE